MRQLGLVHKHRALLISVLVAATVFLVFGHPVSEALIDYGFAIFAPTLMEDSAMALAWAISMPAGIFSEVLPVSRFHMAINGAFWGVIGYLLFRGVLRFVNRAK